jgi:hypothetical protein
MAQTKYHGPTDHNGSRVSATHLTTGRRIVLEWDERLGDHENHERAARHLFAKYLASPDCFTDDLLITSIKGGACIFAQIPKPGCPGGPPPRMRSQAHIESETRRGARRTTRQRRET